MAKKCSIERNDKRKKMAKKYAARIARNKAVIKDANSTQEQVMEAVFDLQKVPNNAYAGRVHSRCALTGRPRGNDNYKKFNICRNMFRKLASEGLIPGVTKSSW